MIDPTVVYGIAIGATIIVASIVIPICLYLDDTAAERAMTRRHKTADKRRAKNRAMRIASEKNHRAALRAIYNR